MENRFTEVIKVLDGTFHNLSLHKERMKRTSETFYQCSINTSLEKIEVPKEFEHGLVKCRISYSNKIETIEYSHYNFRNIKRLRLIKSDTIDYSFKYEDREKLNSLLDQKEDCDDILIIKNGFITDTSFSNVVLENESGLYTPSTYLLAGTKRSKLLNNGVIKEIKIQEEDLKNYSKLYLINAMIDIEDDVSIDISSIR